MKKFTLCLPIVLIIASSVLFGFDQTNIKINNNAEGFWENKGQIVDQNSNLRPDVKFLYDNRGFKLQLKTNSFSYELYKYRKIEHKKLSNKIFLKDVNIPDLEDEKYEIDIHRIDIELVGSNPAPDIITEGKSDDYLNYYKEYTPEEGVCFVHNYQKIIYKDIYPYIDLVFYTNNKKNVIPEDAGILGKQVKYDFIVHPGGMVSDIKLRYDGAKDISIDESGKITLKTSLGDIREFIPLCYTYDGNISASTKEIIKSRFNLLENLVSFKIDNYDKEKYFVLDPTIYWGSYYGGSSEDKGLAVFSTGSEVYVSGVTGSTSNIATSGVHQQTIGGGFDAFFLKMSSSGSRIWCTYYGGSSHEGGSFVVCHSGNVYSGGSTMSSTGIATTGAHQTNKLGDSDGYLVMFNSSGERQWGTYYGGSYIDGINDGVTDNSGNIYVGGVTWSNDNISTTGAHQETFGGNYLSAYDGFIVKFNSSGERQWGTYYGGSYEDKILNLSYYNNNIYFIGRTYSTNGISSSGAYKTSRIGMDDAFIACLNASGERQWGTYFGGNGEEGDWHQISIDNNGDVIVSGDTESGGGLATAGAHQTTHSGDWDGFIGKLSGNGSSCYWATYYGGSGMDVMTGLTVDNNNNIFACGYTSSSSSIATEDVHQSSISGNNDYFIVKFSPSGSRQWGTYFGGSDDGASWEHNNSIHCDGSQYIYITGKTSSTQGIATSEGFQTIKGGNEDAFIAKFPLDMPIKANNISSPLCGGNHVSVPFTTYFDFFGDNVFTAQLSNSEGKFINPVNIGTLSGNYSGTINAQIPDTVSSGNRYKIRVVGSSPAFNGASCPNSIVLHQMRKPAFSGIISVCTKSMVVYSSTTNTTSSDYWTVTGGTIQGSPDSKSIYVLWGNPGTGSVKLEQTNNTAGCKDSTTIHITINPLPNPSITGSNTSCSRKIQPYTTNPVSGVANQWFASNGTVVGSNNGNNVNVLWCDFPKGNIKLIQTITETGCKDSSEMEVTINSTPLPAFTGDTILCEGSVVKYETLFEEGISCQWHIKGGIELTSDLSSITIKWDTSGKHKLGLIKTNLTTSCSDTITKTISVNPLPVTVIQGSKSVCVNSQTNYKPSIVKGNTFEWKVTGGYLQGDSKDSMISVSWQKTGYGYIKLIMTNIYGCSDSSEISITINPLPQPEITGLEEVSVNSTNIYSATINKGLSSKWYATGGTITGKNNDTIVKIKWGEAGTGTIKLVQTISSAGCTDSITKNVTITDKIVPTITGKTTACSYITETYHATENDDLTYFWTVTGGEIQGESTLPEVSIKWLDYRSGTIKLVQTIISKNIKDSVTMQVTLNPTPPKPNIIENKGTLISSSESGNQWFSEGEPIDSAVNKEYIPDKSGNYTVQITSEQNCISEMSDIYKYDITGIDDNDAEKYRISVFPVPSEDKLNITAEFENPVNLKISLYNLLGNIIISDKQQNLTQYKNIIDISNLTAGLYMIEIRFGSEAVHRKIIKR